MNFKAPIDRDCLISGDDKEFKITVAKLIERIPGVKVVNCRSLERGDHRKNHTTASRTTAKNLQRRRNSTNRHTPRMQTTLGNKFRFGIS